MKTEQKQVYDQAVDDFNEDIRDLLKQLNRHHDNLEAGFVLLSLIKSPCDTKKSEHVIIANGNMNGFASEHVILTHLSNIAKVRWTDHMVQERLAMLNSPPAGEG